jgi:peptidoglycan/LPS O-acetylase OafA/YrhL
MKVKSESKKELAYLPYLDGWRGMAIIMVLISHFFGLSPLGHFGVSVFFVLSGFLMSRILFIKKVPLNVFYHRRFARILPAFWLYVSVVFAGGWIFLDEFHLDEFFSTAFFLRTYFPEIFIFKSNLPIGHIWSLNVEEHCYILLSLVSLMAVRFGDSVAKFVLLILSFICVLFFLYYKYYPPLVLIENFKQLIPTEIAALPLLLSCSLFLWMKKYPNYKVLSMTPVISFGAALFVQIFLTSASVFLSYIAIAVLLAISVNTLALAPMWMLTILSNPVLRWFGICSYSIYLWQQIFYFEIFFFGNRHTSSWIYHGWNYYGVIGIAASILVGSLSFYFFESPMRKWLSGRVR